MRSVSPFTRSSMFSTSHRGVNTSAWSATRFLDLIRFIGDGPTSGTLYRHTHDKIAHRGGGNPQLMLSAISLIDLDVRTETPTLAATLARSRLLRSLNGGEQTANCIIQFPAWVGSGHRLFKRTFAAPWRLHALTMLYEGSYCQFLVADLTTFLPKKLRIRNQQELLQMAERGMPNMTNEERQRMQREIANGRSGTWLDLSEEQYLTLKRQ